MTTALQIAEVARRSGFPSSTLRYYDEVGLVPPTARTEAGYRLYDESSLARLAFIARAKQLGCTLEEITDLVTAWEGDRCEPVQTKLRSLVESKIADSESRLVEMAAFSAQLRHAAATLGAHTPDGPCDDDCGCTTTAAGPSASTAVRLTDKPDGEAPPIACTLDAEDLAHRLEAWRAALGPVVQRTALPDGVRLTFAPGAGLGAVTELVVAEQACCRFFRFSITVDQRGAALEVTAPADAQDLVHALFGVPS